MTATVTSLSWTQVCARRLARHALAAPARTGPADVVAGMAGTHAQVMSAAELGVGLRLDGATRADVRRALWEEGSLVKTFGPRGTVHLLPARDLPMWVGALAALPPAPSPFRDPVRMGPEQTAEVVAAIGASLDEADLTIDELSEAVVARTGPWAGDLVMPAFQTFWPRWRQAMGRAAHEGVLCFGPARGRKVTYSSPRRRFPGFRPAGGRVALGDLVRAYLHAYGPATPAMFAHWLNAPAAWAADLFDSLGLETVEVEGRPARVSPGDTAAPADAPRGVRLLPYFDGYAYRVGNQPPELLYPCRSAKRVLRGNFQLMLIDGVVGGLWHQRRSGRRIDLTVEPLVPLTRARRAELDEQAERVAHVQEASPRLTIGTVPVGGHA